MPHAHCIASFIRLGATVQQKTFVWILVENQRSKTITMDFQDSRSNACMTKKRRQDATKVLFNKIVKSNMKYENIYYGTDVSDMTNSFVTGHLGK